MRQVTMSQWPAFAGTDDCHNVSSNIISTVTALATQIPDVIIEVDWGLAKWQRHCHEVLDITQCASARPKHTHRKVMLILRGVKVY